MDDWKKLKRLLGFYKRTLNNVRKIGAKNLKDVYTWIDASYGVDDNMKGQTGGYISMGKGMLHN